MQQQQQPASYDLVAVFNDEAQAGTAASKLRKEGFTDEEVHQIPAGLVGRGEFRQHGPGSHNEFFLQQQRVAPSPALIGLLAVIFAIIVGGLSFASSFAFHLPEPVTVIVGIVIGLVLGIIIGLLRPRRVRGAIGQQTPQVNAPPDRKALQGALTAVALRFNDPDNISRKSRARAILLNNQGKIDRSIGRRE